MEWCRRCAWVLAIMVMMVGCQAKPPSVGETAEQKSTPVAPSTGESLELQVTKSEKPLVAPTRPDVDPSKKYTVLIKTSKGNIICELDAKAAPLSVTNFKHLADRGFYNGLTFHRVVPGFVVQGGDPMATGTGGPGYTIPAEIGLKHSKGAIAWARTGDDVNPERASSGSQFYITLAEVPFLDGAYTVFGRTISGMEIVEKIERGDVMQTVEVSVE